MSSRYYYAPLTAENIQYLKLILKRRWQAAGKRLLISAFLPMAVVLPMLFFINLFIITQIENDKDVKDINIPAGIENYSLLWMAIPVFAILCLVNLLIFIRSVPALYLDIKRGRKKLLMFAPRPYSIPGSEKHYVHTGLPALRFLPVSYEEYVRLDYSRSCFLEITLLTHIPLGIKTIDDTHLAKPGQLQDGH